MRCWGFPRGNPHVENPAPESTPAASAPEAASRRPRHQLFKVDIGDTTTIVMLHATIWASVLPCAFIWAQPLLASWRRRDAHELVGCEVATPCSCAAAGQEEIGRTLSAYVSSAHSTGMMALLFKAHSLIVWDDFGLRAFLANVHADDTHDDLHTFSFATLIAYEVAFGLFLAFPYDYMPRVHMLAVSCMAVFALLSYSTLYLIGAYYREQHGIMHVGLHRNVWPILALGNGAFVCLVGMVVGHYWRGICWGHLFWALECVGLSSLLATVALSRLSNLVATKGRPFFVYALTLGLCGERLGLDKGQLLLDKLRTPVRMFSRSLTPAETLKLAQGAHIMR